MARKDLGTPASNDRDIITKQVTRGFLAQCKIGEWTRTPGAVATTSAMVDNLLYGALVVPGRDCSVDEIGCQCNTSGLGTSPASVFRMGIYTLSIAADGLVGSSLLVDGGTVTSGSTGVRTVSFTPVALGYGRPYMFVLVSQYATVTDPHVFRTEPVNLGISSSSTAIALADTTTWQVADVAGALPSAPTFVTAQGRAPLLAFRCSA